MTKTNILVVDDKLENIKALKLLIESDDINVLAALSAEEALGLLVNHDFALAVLDVQMPGTSGYELARLIRGVRKFKHLPIMFVTAHSREQAFIFEGYETGAVDLLFKPLDPHVVRSKIRVFVQMSQQNQKLKDQIEEMEKLRQQAEAANLAKSRFLANMSHEIRTPLGAVMGFADLISETSLNEEEKVQYASAIRRNGQFLIRIIDDILDFSKIEAQKLDFEKVEFQIEDLFKDVLSVQKPNAEAKKIPLRVDFKASLTESYLSDPVRIKQILFNLLGNAIKFTSKGEVCIQVLKELAVNSQADRLIVRISDTGVGLSEEQRQHIFMPFGQADSSTKRHFGGTGLGLVIARQLARALNGDLYLESSEPQKGSTFVFYLDLEKKQKAVEAEPVREENAGSETSEKKILIVDDIEDNRTLLKRYLTSLPVTIESASSGEEAVEAFKADPPPDLVLMDVQMPGMDGYEATRAIRKLGFDTPILALTAHSGREELENCLISGYNLVLTKPVNRQSLNQALSQYLKLERDNATKR